MFTKIKDAYGNFRRHKKLFALLFILSVICVRMFVQNYQFQQPIISKHITSYSDLSAELAVCNQNLPIDGMSASNKAALALPENADLAK